MEKEPKLSQKDSLLIQLLLMDPVINNQLIDKASKEVYSTVIVDRITGDIVFGKTRWTWLNHFIADEKKISFIDFAMKTVAALSGQQANYDERILNALSHEVITKAVMEGNFTFIVNRLFDACRYGNKSSTRSVSQPPLTDNIKRGIRLGNKVYDVTLNSGDLLGIFNLINPND